MGTPRDLVPAVQFACMHGICTYNLRVKGSWIRLTAGELGIGFVRGAENRWQITWGFQEIHVHVHDGLRVLALAHTGCNSPEWQESRYKKEKKCSSS